MRATDRQRKRQQQLDSFDTTLAAVLTVVFNIYLFGWLTQAPLPLPASQLFVVAGAILLGRLCLGMQPRHMGFNGTEPSKAVWVYLLRQPLVLGCTAGILSSCVLYLLFKSPAVAFTSALPLYLVLLLNLCVVIRAAQFAGQAVGTVRRTCEWNLNYQL